MFRMLMPTIAAAMPPRLDPQRVELAVLDLQVRRQRRTAVDAFFGGARRRARRRRLQLVRGGLGSKARVGSQGRRLESEAKLARC